MGTTFGSVHIYTSVSVSIDSYAFESFSEGWQTLMPAQAESAFDFEWMQRTARAISKRTEAPVLFFFEFDGDFICFKFYQNGKQIAGYGGDGMTPSKNIYKIPALIGFEDGNKRHLSAILGCGNVDDRIALLEEFFGVCLLPFPEIFAESPEDLKRTRGDALYRRFAEAEKALIGKRAPIVAELIKEIDGVERGCGISYQFVSDDLCTFEKIRYSVYSAAHIKGYEERLGCFQNGKFEFVDSDKLPPRDGGKWYLLSNPWEDIRYKHEYYPDRIIFSRYAPPAYAGKILTPLRGFYACGFDGKNRLVLHDERGTIAIMNEEMKIIAKVRLKGYIVAMDGDYILTTQEGKTIYGTIRVYRLCEKT